jgi:AcrR family transcriptional regulator
MGPTLTNDTRTPLTRSRIIDSAVEFADANGAGELSMRKLGAVLGVEAMSLYNHVANKDEILDGMIDYVFSAIRVPDPGIDWRAWIRHTGLAAMGAFGEHPWVVMLLMQRGNFGPMALEFMDRTLGVLRDAGFSDADTHHGWQMLASHTMGYAFQQMSGERQDGVGVIADRLAEVGGRFPNVSDLAPYLAECDFDREFEFGLEIIIDGLASRLGPAVSH